MNDYYERLLLHVRLVRKTNGNPHFIAFLGIMSTVICYLCTAGLTVRDSLLRPLVTKLKPCVSMATPVRWICSSTYLMEDKRKEKHRYTVIQWCNIGEINDLSSLTKLKCCTKYLTETTVGCCHAFWITFNAFELHSKHWHKLMDAWDAKCDGCMISSSPLLPVTHF